MIGRVEWESSHGGARVEALIAHIPKVSASARDMQQCPRSLFKYPVTGCPHPIDLGSMESNRTSVLCFDWVRVGPARAHT
ncbi:hypothetical protein AG1IA_10093 [Rhizoctonia solani AG-1 IA]|uniref:Uncharacterized protein n=1 Tax=Thanatephorus cucumeris (strain AG1-IA) TaxID=983506 RepID=L8WGN5_THACA|nr:hypothetical protein AG1IA_10093 [Rhizoctonia solani AG-1 IA]